MTTDNQTKHITSKVQIICLASIGIIGNLAPFILPVIVGGLVDHLGLNLEQAGYVAFADMCGLGLGAFLWSRMILVASWRNYALLAVILIVGGNILCANINQFYPLMAARLMVGIGGGLLLAIGNSGLTMTPKPDRTIGVVSVIAMLTASATLYLFPLVVDKFGIAMLFYGMAVLTALAGLGVLGMTTQSPYRDQVEETKNIEHVDDTVTSAPLNTNIMALSGVFIFFFGAIIFWVYIERLGNNANFSTETIASVLGTSHLFGALGAMTPAVLGTRLGNRLIPIVFCIALACLTSVLMAIEVNVMLYAFAACAFIFAWDCFYPYLMGILITLEPTGKLVSFGLTVQTVGKAAGPAVAGVIITQFGFSAVYALCGICFLASFFALLPAIRYSDDVLIKDAKPVEA